MKNEQKNKDKVLEVVILVVGIILYLVIFITQTRFSIGGNNNFNGILSQIQNLIVVLMTVKAHKKGYIGAMVLSIVSALSTLFQFIMGHAPIVGVLVPVVTILMITLIYVFYNNMRKANSELFDTIKELNASNAALKEKDETLMYLAYHDILTGLANKQKLMEVLEERVSNHSSKPFSVIEANIDNIKEITDTYGLNTGDEIIFNYADKINNICGDKYFLARLGTGRFIILIDGMQTQNDIINITNAINVVINEPVVVKDIAFKTTMSYGVVTYPSNAQTPEKIIQYVNSTIDYVTSHGGNNICFFTNNNQSTYIN